MQALLSTIQRLKMVNQARGSGLLDLSTSQRIAALTSEISYIRSASALLLVLELCKLGVLLLSVVLFGRIGRLRIRTASVAVPPVRSMFQKKGPTTTRT